MSVFHKQLAKLMGVWVGSKSTDELEKEIIDKLKSKLKSEELNRKIEDDTRGMTEYQKKQYFDSWSGH